MPHNDHDAIVNDWWQNAQAHDDENYRFLRRLKQRVSGKKVDQVAQHLHQEVFQIIDCTRCANCCRTLRPVFTTEDIERIAKHLGQSRAEFIAAYLELNEEGQYRTKTTPCPLLGEDGRCTVYGVRPRTCQEYPYTDKKEFVFSMMSRANSALVCPAAFAIIEGMTENWANSRASNEFVETPERAGTSVTRQKNCVPNRRRLFRSR